MNTHAAKKIISIFMTLCLMYGQGFAQVAFGVGDFKKQNYTAVADNTRVVKPLITAKMQNDAMVYLDLQNAADQIINLSSTGLKTPAQQQKFNKIANAYSQKFYYVAIGKTKVSAELYHKIYGAVLPLVWFNADLKSNPYFHKISALYRNQYSACLNNLKKCDFDKTGNAMLFLNSYNPDLINLSKLSSVMVSENVDENAKINFFQYAAPVMADRGGKVYFEEIIEKLSAQNLPSQKVTEGYFDPFAFVKAFDNSYQWIKSTCTHKDGFGGGVCAAFKGGKNPFRQYKTYPLPATLKNMIQTPSDKGSVKLISLFASKVKQPAQLAAAIRMYAEFYSGEFYWNDTFKFLLNASLPSENVVTCHKDIALSELALKAPSSVRDQGKIRLYMAARINNDYFALNNDSEIDSSVKAALKNELGAVYAKLTGYKGASPVKVLSDEGFYSDIAFKNNEKEIEGFWGSMFNFKDRPAEAVTNVFILGLITKGAVKNSGKIWAAVANLFKNGEKIIVNMPSLVKRAQVQYKVLKYLAAKNSMSLGSYAYKNAVYRTASNTAVKGLNTVEGVASKEFFASSHYNAASHGNIGRISKDIKTAVSKGLTDLGKGGSIPSYVTAEEYAGGFNTYTKDLLKQQEILQRQVASKYKAAKLPAKSVTPSQAQAAQQNAASATHSLPRNYMYSADKSGGLQFAQSEGFAQEYSFKNTVYKGLKQRGFDFVNTKTGLSLGNNLTFHQDGFLQASGKVGLSYAGGSTGSYADAFKSILQGTTQNLLAPVNQLKTIGQSSVALRETFDILNSGSVAASLNNLFMPSQKAFEAYYKVSLMSVNAMRGGSLGGPLNTREFLPNYSNATFKVSRSEGDTGSGFLLNYRGMPVIVTAGHVVRSNKFVTVQDINGNKERGVVLDAVHSPGLDLAAIAVSPSFLLGKVPFELALREPKPNEIVYAFSYPGGGDYSRSVLRVLQTNYTLSGSKVQIYRTTPDNLTYGSSGGPMSLGDLKSKVTGVAYALTYKQDNALFVGLRALKNFMGGIARQMVMNPVYRSQYLPMFPGFVKNYSNVLGKYITASSLIKSSPVKLPEIGFRPDINLMSEVNKEAAIEQLNKSTFKITRKSDGSGGSGFYIKYRGLPMIVTAAHVVRDDNVVEVLDNEGILSFGKVFARSSISRGYDFAIVLPEKGFLEDKTPLPLAFKEPSVGEQLFLAGFPKDKWVKNVEITLADKRYLFPEHTYSPVYKAFPSAEHGQSGGPLVQLGSVNKVVGVAHMTGENDSFFATMPELRRFLSSTFKSKFLDASFSQEMFLKEYPEVAKSYKNILNAYKDKIGTYNPTPAENAQARIAYLENKLLEDDMRFTSTRETGLSKYNKAALSNATFMITRANGESFGSGFYIKHRGVPMIVTAAHVVGEDKVVSLTDKNGFVSVARVLNTTGVNRGYDIALLITAPRFLEDRVPLTLSPKAPAVGESMVALGFDMLENVLAKPFTLTSVSRVLENSLGPVYQGSPALVQGMSGGPLSRIETTGRISGISHMADEKNSFFIPVSTLRGFIKKTFIADLQNPAKSVFANNFPEFRQQYSNVLQSNMLVKKEPAFNIGEGTKRFLFKTMTGVFGMKPKNAMDKLYGWGAKPRQVGYPIAGGPVFKIDDLSSVAADLSKPVPQYPFSANKVNYYRGMALNMESLQNIRANGVRLEDVGTHNNDYLTLRYPSAGLAEYAKNMDCNKTICFTSDPKGAAHYALKHVGAQTPMPVVIHVKDVALGTDASLGSSILLTALSDVPASKIVNYSGLLNVDGENTWGKITFDDNKSILFTPYTTGTRTNGPSMPAVSAPDIKLPSLKQLTKLPELYQNFGSIFKKPALSPALATQYNLPGLRSLINGNGIFGERFMSFDLAPYREYFMGVRSAVVEVEVPLMGRKGSGFYLKKDNMEALITAGHIVEGASTARIRSAASNGKWYTAKVAGYSLGETNDIGLLQISDESFWEGMKPLSLAQNYPDTGAEILSYGFPWGIGFEERAGTFKGFTSVNNGRLIVASEHTAPGSSGGPIMYNGKVIGICKKGICKEDIARNPAKMRSIEPASYHITWETLNTFLNKAVLKTMPVNLQSLIYKYPFKYSSVMSVYKNFKSVDTQLLLNPRSYGFRNIEIFERPALSDDILLGSDYGLTLNETTKKMGVKLLKNVLKIPAKDAFEVMYKYGAKPYYAVMPKTAEGGYVIDDISLHKPDMTKTIPPYPFGDNKRYIFRGMALDSHSVTNIDENGLRLQDVGASNNLYLHAIAPGASRYINAESNRTICLTETPSDAAFYSMRDLPENKPVPTVVNVKGITQKNTMGFGILFNGDIPRANIASINLLLNINGKNVWGRAVTQSDGKIVFYPYKYPSDKLK